MRVRDNALTQDRKILD
jgi:hypothetical protein